MLEGSGVNPRRHIFSQLPDHRYRSPTTAKASLIRSKRANGRAFYVQDIELIQMSKAMRDADDNKAHPGQIYINYQGQAEGMQDNAPSEFFYYVDPAVLQKPSYSQFIAMMNNFNREGGVDEPRVSREEEGHEISTFLTTILASRPWQILYSFLYHKGHPFAQSPYIFRAWIEHLWFRHYSRSRGWAHDSSAFEHVFMGELLTIFKSKSRARSVPFEAEITVKLIKSNGEDAPYAYVTGSSSLLNVSTSTMI
ncbi:endoribonuclease XendoU [Ancylostoma ceylanicum]|uniref:Endoribonuclease XendoU n=1 Tax=Ancylostoma ceylanicum TaxID=53326 RepID=A0A0D6M0Y4_9BILA|nr:endoribonuclease XendoU [Ancylostoma ceylanicum]